MAQIELTMPKMGESIIEATILKWVKVEGDRVEEDDTILEIATDKVDSEVPSPVEGVIEKILFQEDDVVEVGKVIALINTESTVEVLATPATASPSAQSSTTLATTVTAQPAEATSFAVSRTDSKGRFYSPLVRSIAQEEGISMTELEQITGSGSQNRVTKDDIMSYLSSRQSTAAPVTSTPTTSAPVVATAPASTAAPSFVANPTPSSNGTTSKSTSGDTEIIEMDRMRRLIADHMVRSKQTSPHVTSFVEVDVTNLVNWRNQVKGQFQKTHGEKITFTPIFMDAVVKAIRDFPMINVSVDGNNIVRKKNINIGMATALPSGNLIVPVIKQADRQNLLGLTKSVNDLARRARANQLKPEDIQDGTFTVTNVGTFGNVMGTPIINQPQVAILATGAIKKKPAVLETEFGDVIAVRQMMFLSLSYDHRVVDGFLGGSFLRRVADYLEAFDTQQTV
jgi:2-oxoglutarate dehydrogenase E2 component (dihydrolipoamide succinyltransferase)